MASVASQLTEEVTAHSQSDSIEDERAICSEGSYFPNNLRTLKPAYDGTTKDRNFLPFQAGFFQYRYSQFGTVWTPDPRD